MGGDEAIGHLLKLTDKDTLVVVVSDHGFEAATSSSDEASLLREFWVTNCWMP